MRCLGADGRMPGGVPGANVVFLSMPGADVVTILSVTILSFLKSCLIDPLFILGTAISKPQQWEPAFACMSLHLLA